MAEQQKGETHFLHKSNHLLMFVLKSQGSISTGAEIEEHHIRFEFAAGYDAA
jgi:hypothetical protein